MKHLRSFIFLTAVFFIPCSVFADGGIAPIRLSFSSALKIANEQNPSVIMAGERVKQALERLHGTRAGLLPRVSAEASEIRQTKNLETFGIPPSGSSSPVVGPFNAFDARLKLTQVLFDWPTVKRLEAAGIGRDLSKAEERKTREDALAFVAALYLEAKRAEDALWFSKAIVRLAREKNRLAYTHLKWGTGSEVDLKEAKAGLSEARFQWRTAKTKAQDKKLDLKAALGFSGSQILEFLDEDLSLADPPPKRSEILSAAKVHPEVNLAEEKLRRTKAEEAAEQAEILPKVSGLADYGASADQPSQSKKTYSYGLQASWPLFEGGRRSARIAESESRSREAEVDFKDIRNQKENRAVEAKEALKNTRVLIQSARDNFNFYQARSGVIKRRFENGTASELDVIRAMAEEAQAKDGWEEALAAYRMAQVSLAHALGQMEKLTK